MQYDAVGFTSNACVGCEAAPMQLSQSMRRAYKRTDGDQGSKQETKIESRLHSRPTISASATDNVEKLQRWETIAYNRIAEEHVPKTGEVNRPKAQVQEGERERERDGNTGGATVSIDYYRVSSNPCNAKS